MLGFFKASRISQDESESVLKSQDEVITRKPERRETESDEDKQALHRWALDLQMIYRIYKYKCGATCISLISN